MKVILDIDEKDLKNMQGYCEIHQYDLGQLMSHLFNKYIQKPATIIDTLNEHNHNISPYFEFIRIFKYYLNETMEDIQSSIGTSEEYEDDKLMLEVFKRFNLEHTNDHYLIADLFTIYWDKKVEYQSK